MARYYLVHGLTVGSDIELPALTEASSTNSPDCRVIDAGIIRSVRSRHGFAAAADGFEIWWSSVGQFTVSRDGDIIIRRLPGVTDDLLRLPLTGCILALSAQRKGRFLLHGNSINVHGCGIILVGCKGQGKSTLTASLLSRGHTLLSDDASALTVSPRGAIVSHRGCLQLKLWPDSLANWAEAAQLPHQPMHGDCAKRIVPANQFASAVDPVPLARIYSLMSGRLVAAHRLSTSDAWREIFAHSYAARFGDSFLEPIAKMQHFIHCSRLAATIGVIRLERTSQYEDIDDLATLLEHDVTEAKAVASSVAETDLA